MVFSLFYFLKLEAERHSDGDGGGFTSPVAVAAANKTRTVVAADAAATPRSQLRLLVTPATEQHFRNKVTNNNHSKKKHRPPSSRRRGVVHKKAVAAAVLNNNNTPRGRERQATIDRKCAIALMKKIHRFHCDEGAVSEHCVYDSGPEIAQKVRRFFFCALKNPFAIPSAALVKKTLTFATLLSPTLSTTANNRSVSFSRRRECPARTSARWH